MSDNISTLIGILLDVSYSMKKNVGGGVGVKREAWARSIFRVIDDLIKHDVSSSNRVFAVGVGANCEKEIFDLIGTLEKLQNRSYDRSYDETIESVLTILENNGAGTVRKWATINVIRKAVPRYVATLILSTLESHPNFVTSVVNDCLPPACRDFRNPFSGKVTGVGIVVRHLNVLNTSLASVVSTFRQATEKDVKEVVEKATGMLPKDVLKDMLKDFSVGSSIFSVQRASNIVHGCVTEEELTETRIQELMTTVVPFIYGETTPLFSSLEKAAELFSDGRYRDHKKVLFVLSDGDPSDYPGSKYQLLSKFRNADVKVVSCFITNSTHVEPHRLYCTADQKWTEYAKLMFELSSTIPTQLLPRTVLIKRQWKIDIENNETKLFLQINHPDIIRDACDLARNVVCSQDALSDVLVSVSLDIYINECTTGFRAQEQVGGTCYANASAAVLHLSMKRILGREGDYPDFKQLRQQLIDLYGEDGAKTLKVLQEVCPQYRLRCQEVNIVGAMKAITAKRPVVATFRLTDAEWDVFRGFYRSNPTAILTKKEIDIPKRPSKVKTSGHAVVLTSYNSECLRLMNSWGHKWGDMGFFRVKTADVIGLKFVDVFWESEDLTENEKAYYDRHGAEVAKWLMDNLTGLQLAEYQCPLCIEKSLVTEFKGQLLRATCPKCSGEFRSDGAGNILALNMYLTSLSR